MGETAMSPSSSTDMSDVDMASIAEDELSEKFSVQGIATGRTGRNKVVRTSNAYRYVCFDWINIFDVFSTVSDAGKFRIFKSARRGNIWKGDSVP